MATRTEKAIALGPEDLSLGQDLFGIGAYLCGLVFRGTALVEMGRLDDIAPADDDPQRFHGPHPSGLRMMKAC